MYVNALESNHFFKIYFVHWQKNEKQFILTKVIVSTDNKNDRQLILSNLIMSTHNDNDRQFILTKVIVSTDSDSNRQTQMIEDQMYKSAFLNDHPFESYHVYRQRNDRQIFSRKLTCPQITTTTDRRTGMKIIYIYISKGTSI